MKSSLRLTLHQVEAVCENFPLELRNRFAMLETMQDIDEANNSLVRVIRKVDYNHFRPKRPGRNLKLTSGTLDFMRMTNREAGTTRYLPSEYANGRGRDCSK